MYRFKSCHAHQFFEELITVPVWLRSAEVLAPSLFGLTTLAAFLKAGMAIPK